MKKLTTIILLLLLCSFAHAETFIVQSNTQEAIEVAFNQVELNKGGTVILPHGTVVLTSEIRVTCDNLTIKGEGCTLYTDFEDPQNMGLRLTGKYLDIDGISFEANPEFKRPESGGYLLTLLGCKYFRISDCNLLNSPAGHIWIGRESSFGIVSGHIIGTDERKDILETADGIQVSGGSHDIIINDGIITRTGDDAVSIGTYWWDEEKTHDIVITSQKIRGSRCHGIIATKSDNIDMVNNSISDCLLAGIAVYDYGNWQHAPSENVVVKNNILRNNGIGESLYNRGRHCSIWIDSVGLVTLKGNEIFGNPIFVYNCRGGD